MTPDYPHIPKSLDTITPISADLAHHEDCALLREIRVFCWPVPLRFGRAVYEDSSDEGGRQEWNGYG